MAKKYTYSRQLGDETFSAVEFDSFDEARKVVEKAVYERTLELKPKENPPASASKAPSLKVKDVEVPNVSNPPTQTLEN